MVYGKRYFGVVYHTLIILLACPANMELQNPIRTKRNDVKKEFSDADLLVLRRVMCIHDVEDIDKILLKYAEMVELFSANFPSWDARNVADWAASEALAPEWLVIQHY